MSSYKKFPGKKSAESYVASSAPNLMAVGLPHEGRYIAVAALRPDQEWIRDRLRERGILVCTVVQLEALAARLGDDAPIRPEVAV